MGFSEDTRFKLDKPCGTVRSSTEPRPSKVATTVPSDNLRADEITIEMAKSGKVTAVVVVLSIYCKKRCN
jgi:hypothetical protein